MLAIPAALGIGASVAPAKPPVRTPAVQFNSSSVSSPETTSPVRVPITLSSTGNASVSFSTANGTATPGTCGTDGVDYEPVSPTRVTFAGTSQVNSPPITVCHNPQHEPSETILLRLSDPSGAALGTNSAETLTITDSDPLPPPPADVLWTADAELPWGQEWANYSCQSADRFALVASPLAQGLSAYRIQVRDGDDSYGERCELAMGNPTKPGFPLYNEGDERWIAWQVYLPSTFPINASSWNVITQLKQLGSLGTPALSMEVQGGRFIQFNSNTNGSSCCTVALGSWPAVQGRWVRFTYHVKFSPDPAVGFVELYGDIDGSGQRVLLPMTHTWTMKRQGGTAVQSHSRIGIYRDSAISGTADIYYDGYTIATTKAAAEANAFGPPILPSVP